MKNFIIRTITGVLFVAAVVTCFLNPRAMALFFALVTGLTIWEFTGLVNERPKVQVNRLISTVAGVYLFLAMAGYNSGITPSTVFIPYLVSIIYLMIAELYLKAEDPIANWAYTMMSQLYIALPFSLLNVLAYRWDGLSVGSTIPAPIYVARCLASTNCSLAYRRESLGKEALVVACL